MARTADEASEAVVNRCQIQHRDARQAEVGQRDAHLANGEGRSARSLRGAKAAAHQLANVAVTAILVVRDEVGGDVIVESAVESPQVGVDTRQVNDLHGAGRKIVEREAHLDRKEQGGSARNSAARQVRVARTIFPLM